jgi:hypothetical protein
MFCTFCLCTKAQLEDFDPSTWILRNGRDVQDEAALWLSTVTNLKKKKFTRSRRLENFRAGFPSQIEKHQRTLLVWTL